jgi:hypothetical protein
MTAMPAIDQPTLATDGGIRRIVTTARTAPAKARRPSR